MKLMLLQIIGAALLLLLTGCLSNTIKKRTSTANLHIQLGFWLMQTHKSLPAEAQFATALQLAPNNSASWYSMGYYLASIGRFAEAKHDCLHALQLNPHSAPAHNNYGVVLCQHHQYPQAIAQFLIAAKTIGYLRVADAYKNAGLCALLTHQIKQARKYFQMAQKNSPSNISIRRFKKSIGRN